MWFCITASAKLENICGDTKHINADSKVFFFGVWSTRESYQMLVYYTFLNILIVPLMGYSILNVFM